MSVTSAESRFVCSPAERAADLMSSEPGDVHPQVWLSVLAEPLPARPQRRAARVRAREDEQVFIDGVPVTLLDVSANGAQVVSTVVLRPQQRIRLVMPPERGSIKTAAMVAWSTFEIGPTPQYRAGIAFTRAIPDLVGREHSDRRSARPLDSRDSPRAPGQVVRRRLDANRATRGSCADAAP